MKRLVLTVRALLCVDHSQPFDITVARRGDAYGEDLAFLKDLLKEGMVAESDMKDIVNDGIRFL